MTDASLACHVCGASPLRLLDGSGEFSMVSSDCRPSPWRGPLAVCPACATVVKPLDAAWSEATAAIYARYDIYHQSNGQEQPTFVDGRATPRSAALLRWLEAKKPFRPEGILSDAGCGNGAFLRVFSSAHPSWRLRGLEWGERHHDEVKAIPGVECFDSSGLSGLCGTNDAVSMIHVLEHIPDPGQALGLVREHLAPDGVLILLVPDHTLNPFDLAIADHCTHFGSDSLVSLLEDSGFEVLAIDRGAAIPKEIAAVARPSARRGRTASGADGATRDALTSLRFLTSLLGVAGAISRDEPVGIFGTSVGGIWLASQQGVRTGFFVDEDPSRLGKELMGLPVYAPADVPAGSSIVVPLAPSVADAVISRLGPIMRGSKLIGPCDRTCEDAPPDTGTPPCQHP